jgi:hypothetical protein
MANELDPPHPVHERDGSHAREKLAQLLEGHLAPCANCCEMISTDARYCSRCGMAVGHRVSEVQFDSLAALGIAEPVDARPQIDRLAQPAEAADVPRISKVEVSELDPMAGGLANLRKSAGQWQR